MSDQTPGTENAPVGSAVPEPPAPPAMPDVPVAPPMPDIPAAPPYTPTYAPPMTPTGEPPKKSRKKTWIIVGVILVLLLCCCTTAGIGAFIFSGPSAADDAASVTKAEKSFTTPYDALLKYSSSSNTDSVDGTTFFTTQKELAGAARKGIQAADTAAASIGDDATKVEYLASLKKVDDALALLEGADAAELDVDTITSDLTKALAKVDAANTTRAAALASADAEKWAAALTDAQSSLDVYTAVKAQLDDLDSRYPGVGIAAVNDYLSLKIKLAEKLIEMAKAGQSGDTKAVGTTTTEYNALVDEANAATVSDIVNDPAKGVPAAVSKAMKDAVSAVESAATAHDAVVKKLAGAK